MALARKACGWSMNLAELTIVSAKMRAIMGVVLKL